VRYVEFVRREKGLSQATLGQLARMRQSDIGLIEHGRLIPSSKQLERLAQVLGVPASSLLRTVAVELAEQA
jgi:transcriptional regulator with XRE-family HTH domain